MTVGGKSIFSMRRESRHTQMVTFLTMYELFYFVNRSVIDVSCLMNVRADPPLRPIRK